MEPGAKGETPIWINTHKIPSKNYGYSSSNFNE